MVSASSSTDRRLVSRQRRSPSSSTGRRRSRNNGSALRNQAEEEKHFLHLRGAASNPELVILAGELEIEAGRTDGLQRSDRATRSRRRHNRVLRAMHDQRRQRL